MAPKFSLHPGIVLPLILGVGLGGIGVGSVVSDHFQEKRDLRGDSGPAAQKEAALAKAARDAVAQGAPLRVYLGSLDGPSIEASCAPVSGHFNKTTTCTFQVGADQATPEIKYVLDQPRENFALFPTIFPLADGALDATCQPTQNPQTPGWNCIAKIDRDDLRDAQRAQLVDAEYEKAHIQTR